MKNILYTIILSFLLLSCDITVTNTTGDFQAGLDAYQAGDYATALKEFRSLAEQGNVDAQYNLGLMYAKGKGVTQDYKEAVKWYLIAAEQGYAGAQHNLGNMYARGEGVTQDEVIAHMWLNISASNGIENVKENIDIVESKMSSEQLVEAQKLARECIKKNYKDCG